MHHRKSPLKELLALVKDWHDEHYHLRHIETHLSIRNSGDRPKSWDRIAYLHLFWASWYLLTDLLLEL